MGCECMCRSKNTLLWAKIIQYIHITQTTSSPHTLTHKNFINNVLCVSCVCQPLLPFGVNESVNEEVWGGTLDRLKSDCIRVEANAVISTSFRLSQEIAWVIASERSFFAVFQLVKLCACRWQEWYSSGSVNFIFHWELQFLILTPSLYE